MIQCLRVSCMIWHIQLFPIYLLCSSFFPLTFQSPRKKQYHYHKKRLPNCVFSSQLLKPLGSSLIMAFLLMWNSGDRSGKRQVGRECWGFGVNPRETANSRFLTIGEKDSRPLLGAGVLWAIPCYPFSATARSFSKSLPICLPISILAAARLNVDPKPATLSVDTR